MRAETSSGRYFRRVATLRPFPLPGGDRAAREPRRAALGLLHAALPGEAAVRARAAAWFTDGELRPLVGMLASRGLAPLTSSVGRLFDAVAALAGVRLRASYEGQAAMELEAAAADVDPGSEPPYPLPFATTAQGPALLDTAPLVRALLDDLDGGAPPAVVSARFHEALARAAVLVAERAAVRRVVLSGGCFQNRRLAARARALLEASGREVHAPLHFPPNDGALCLGQALVAARRWRERRHERKEPDDVSRSPGPRPLDRGA